MKVIRHAGVDSRMIILDNQACQQMTRYFQLSLQCNVLPVTVCLTVLVNFLVPNPTQEGGHLEGEKTFVTDKDLCQLQKFLTFVFETSYMSLTVLLHVCSRINCSPLRYSCAVLG